MAYVITQNCCKDASCVPACPVDCIRPLAGAVGEPGAQMLFIDPETCIDCGACADECPVGAVYSEYDLPPELERFRDINAAYFQRHPLEATVPETVSPAPARAELRVAVVGAGPAACYAAAELLGIPGVEVDLFERLPTPFGLIRAGVAPDHQRTKSIVKIFDRAFSDSRFGCHLHVEAGRDITHDELLAHHHAVIYAVGASDSRDLGIAGEELPGNYAAADFVGWYNGHPDHADRSFELSGSRAVIIGNGNVALDVARMLLLDAPALGRTDIAEHAADALADSGIGEVVILGRRGPREGAFSAGEFHALGHLPGIDVVIEGGDLTAHPDDDVETTIKLELAREYADRGTTPGNRRIVFRFNSSPVELTGRERVTGVRVLSTVPGENATELLDTALVLRSIGFRGRALAGLPFDDAAGIIPNERGRVVDSDGRTLPGTYVTGWIKRGPRGVIGTNRTCAAETVAQLLADYAAGTLHRDVGDRGAVRELLAGRGITPVDWPGWRAIDDAERARGASAARPRVKFVTIPELLAGSRG
ncbi:FAD-dependent oxidoreductase [Nocardia sp. NPDC057668]|uniref:FAD-dependent oxidoreductase n=1 Tax=Nocardia sp. NPDC057668 TaxID=3346202 RepID=UPI003672B096